MNGLSYGLFFYCISSHSKRLKVGGDVTLSWQEDNTVAALVSFQQCVQQQRELGTSTAATKNGGGTLGYGQA